MKQKTTFVTTAVALGLLLASAAFAQSAMEDAAGSPAAPDQQEASEPAVSEEPQTAEEPHILKTSELIGYRVINTDGEELGTIKEIVIDPHEARVAYAVLSFGGFLGLGDKLFALPWETLVLNPDTQTVYLSIEKEKLQAAPGFDQTRWPDMASLAQSTTHNYSGQTPYWEKDGNPSASPSESR